MSRNVVARVFELLKRYLDLERYEAASESESVPAVLATPTRNSVGNSLVTPGRGIKVFP